MQGIDLQVVVDPAAPAALDDAVTFETGATRAQVADPGLYAYNHHGPEFSRADPGALTTLVLDLLQGRPMPLRFVTHRLGKPDVLLAITAFLRRDICIAPRLLGLVAEVDTAHRFGTAFLAHLEPDLCAFLAHLDAYLPAGLNKQEQGRRLGLAVEWVADYVNHGALPQVRRWPRSLQIVEHGTGGFGVGRTEGEPVYGWVEMFRRGYLRGAVLGPGGAVWIGRKSGYVPFDLDRGAFLLTELEGRPWGREGEWVISPEGGTRLPLDSLLSVLVRI